MTQRNETPALVLSLLLVAGILGGGFWWLTRSWNPSAPTLTQTQPTDLSEIRRV